MNSRTSRPRSPTRPITLTAAAVFRAIMPSSVDLPTPEPAKMPSRWPRPHGITASSARTPSASRRSIGGRPSGLGGRSLDRLEAHVGRSGPLPSIGRPSPSSTRPSRPSPTGAISARPVATTSAPGRMPCMPESGIRSVLPVRNPTACARTSSPRAHVADRAHLPHLDLRPVRLDDEADTSATRPPTRYGSAFRTRSV